MIITILAGGLGKRMMSDIPKVLHTVHGIPMIVRIVTEAKKVKPTKIIVVVGKYHDIIKLTLENHGHDDIMYAIQKETKGTGDAVKSTIDLLTRDETNIILNGDTPLLRGETIQKIYDHFETNNSILQITTLTMDDPFGNGRCIIKNGEFEKIVEEKDCDIDERFVDLVNVGIYVAKTDIIIDLIPKITNNNAQNEYYLTDMVALCKQHELFVGTYQLDQSNQLEITNVNTKEQLIELENIKNI